MCSPTAALVTATALSAGSAGVSFIQKDRQAKASNRFKQARFAATRESAAESFNFGVQQLQRRGAQEIDAANQKSLSVSRRVDQQKGRAQAFSGAANVGGQAVADAATQFDRLEAENEFAIRRNLDNTLTQLNAEARGLRAGAQNRINRALPQLKTGPSGLGLALEIGNIAAQGAFQRSQLE